jgi:hypothetical protein
MGSLDRVRACYAKYRTNMTLGQKFANLFNGQNSILISCLTAFGKLEIGTQYLNFGGLGEIRIS